MNNGWKKTYFFSYVRDFILKIRRLFCKQTSRQGEEIGITARYTELRREVLQAFRKAQPVLDRVKEKLINGDFELPSEKLEKEKFTLTLVGAFQSGKSTLFSYLCGGWELSPVGKGIRTTGCCVTATPLPAGTHDYAEVTWFDPSEIKAAVSDYTGKEISDIQIEDKRWCRAFEQELLGRAREQEATWDEDVWEEGKSSGEELKELELALLMLHFYHEYRRKCERGEKQKYKDVEQVITYACYPGKWEQTWKDVKTPADIDRFFKPENVAFAFCKRIDYYLDSPDLRALGCTIQDCPGMFASRRDSDLAREIIRKSDAILCTIPGNKQLSEEERKCIGECKANGAAHKIFFGANLHTSLQHWEDTIKPEVVPQMEKMGFVKPEIFHYHAPLALCCRELFQLLYSDLHQASKKAIMDRIEASKSKSDTLARYLEKRVNHWIAQLDDGEGDCLENYKGENGKNIQWQKLDELHQVPKLIEHLKNTLLPRKMRSILLDSGLIAANEVMNRVFERLGRIIGELRSGQQKTEGELKEQEERIETFRVSKERLDREEEYKLENELNNIRTKLKEIIEAVLGQTEKGIISDIKGNYMWGTSDWVGKTKKRRAFEEYLKGKVREMLINIRDKRLAGEFPSIIKGTHRVLTEYAEKTCKLVNRAFPGITMRPPNIEGYGEQAIEQISVPSYKEIDSVFAKHEKSELRQFADVFTLGVFSDVGEDDRARKIWGDLKSQVLTILSDAVEAMLNSDDSPIRQIEKFANSLKEKSNAICSEYRQDMYAIQEALLKSAHEKEKTIRGYIPLQNQIRNIQKEFSRIVDKINNYL